MDGVIFRYHKFVKPAFDEYIRPTRKLADVIIPRGAENTVAIDLVAQHLKYQLTKIFSNKPVDSKDLTLRSQKAIVITLNDVIDPKFQFYDGKIVVNEDSAHVETLQNIFQDFINGKNLAYSQMFVDFLINSLLSTYSRYAKKQITQNEVLVTELDDWKKVIASKEATKRVIYYQTSLLVESDFLNLE